jgi:hypothetical protein
MNVFCRCETVVVTNDGAKKIPVRNDTHHPYSQDAQANIGILIFPIFDKGHAF